MSEREKNHVDRRTLVQLALIVVLTGFLTGTIADCRMGSWRTFESPDLAGTARAQDGSVTVRVLVHEAMKSQDDKSKEPSVTHRPRGSEEAVPWTEFMQAAAGGDHETLRRLLKEGANPNVESSNGWTPLRWAADGGHVNAASVLIGNGADIELFDERGTTALMLAALRKRDDVIDILLKRGASPNTADKNGLTPLMIAASKGDTPTARKFLGLGAKVDARDKSGRTALMRASNVPVVDLLIRQGADVNAKSHEGMTPLMAAAEDHNEKVILALLH